MKIARLISKKWQIASIFCLSCDGMDGSFVNSFGTNISRASRAAEVGPQGSRSDGGGGEIHSLGSRVACLMWLSYLFITFKKNARTRVRQAASECVRGFTRKLNPSLDREPTARRGALDCNPTTKGLSRWGFLVDGWMAGCVAAICDPDFCGSPLEFSFVVVNMMI